MIPTPTSVVGHNTYLPFLTPQTGVVLGEIWHLMRSIAPGWSLFNGVLQRCGVFNGVSYWDITNWDIHVSLVIQHG